MPLSVSPEDVSVTIESQPVCGGVAVLVPLLQAVLQPVLTEEGGDLAQRAISHHVEHILSLTHGGLLPALPVLLLAVQTVPPPASVKAVIVVLEGGCKE